MNQLTDLCCSFELAKEIYDLGFVRESVFNWAIWQETCMGLTEGMPVIAMKLRDGIEFNMVGFNWAGAGMQLIPAYTVGELLDFLLERCESIRLSHTEKVSQVNYLAKQLIWSIEQKLIEV